MFSRVIPIHFLIIPPPPPPPSPKQVDEWYPELIEIEERAKSDASLLLFVVDNQTRAVSSMVEIAYFAGEFVILGNFFAMLNLLPMTIAVHVCYARMKE